MRQVTREEFREFTQQLLRDGHFMPLPISTYRRAVMQWEVNGKVVAQSIYTYTGEAIAPVYELV
jgi:hypothetical protein